MLPAFHHLSRYRHRFRGRSQFKWEWRGWASSRLLKKRDRGLGGEETVRETEQAEEHELPLKRSNRANIPVVRPSYNELGKPSNEPFAVLHHGVLVGSGTHRDSRFPCAKQLGATLGHLALTVLVKKNALDSANQFRLSKQIILMGTLKSSMSGECSSFDKMVGLN